MLFCLSVAALSLFKHTQDNLC